MPRPGFVICRARVCERREPVAWVELSNGHRLVARRRLRDGGTVADLEPGDWVEVEVPVSDPSSGILLRKVENG